MLLFLITSKSHAVRLLLFGMLKKNVAPLSTSLSAQHVPPCLTIILFTFASPIPIPSKSLALCNRWNTPNSLSAYFMSKPAPLSLMENMVLSFSVLPPILITACSLFRDYFIAFDIRLTQT
jgi:hypothetical protein